MVIQLKYTWHHLIVFILTFLSYATLHVTRKAFGNVKPSLVDNWTPSAPNNFTNTTIYPDSTWNSHKLFDSERAATLFLGLLDTLFLFAYSFGLYVNGYLGDIFDPRKVLSLGMILSGITVIIFGYVTELFRFYNVFFYGFLWIINGLFQSSGWPAAVAIMGPWFGDSKGLIFGIWSSCASFGNVIGDLLTGGVVECGYEYGFLVPAAVLVSMGVLIWAGVIINPLHTQKGIPPGTSAFVEQSDSEAESLASQPLISREPSIASSVSEEEKSYGFWKACLIPGVIPYALAYACLKCVNYAFFFWLPFYLSNKFHWSTSKADQVSVWYDVGGIVGSIVIGFVSDFVWSRSPVNIAMLVLAVPALFIYSNTSDVVWINSLVMAAAGFCINTPANMISTTISAELGTNKEIAGNSKALSTVTGIIDGTGSFGAAIGQFVVSMIQTNYGWSVVFYFFIVMLLMTIICILPVFVKDVRARFCSTTAPSIHEEIPVAF